MDIISKEEKLPASVIPSTIGGKHIVVLPDIGRKTEGGKIQIGLIHQFLCLDENRVREHIHIILKCEFLDLGIIRTVAAFDDLTILVTHSSSVHKHCHRVLRIIVQMPGPQRIMILVRKLYHRASELRKIIIDEILEIVAGQNGLLLKDADIAPGINYLGLHIPKSRITDEVGVVMKETCRAYDLSVSRAFHIHHLCRFGTQEHDKAVLLFLL